MLGQVLVALAGTAMIVLLNSMVYEFGKQEAARKYLAVLAVILASKDAEIEILKKQLKEKEEQ